MLILFSILFFSGLIKFINLHFHIEDLNYFAGLLSDIHDWSGIILGIFITIHLVLHWKWIVTFTKRIGQLFKKNKITINYLINIGMIISFILVLITGIIKLPYLYITQNILYMYSIILLVIHDWSGLSLLILVTSHILLHWKWIKNKTKKILVKRNAQIISIGTISTAIISVLFIPTLINSMLVIPPEDDLLFEKFEPLKLNPENVQTIRSDLFREGHYSVFDILVNLKNAGKIEMEYHYDVNMDTYVIDSLNGTNNWWYYAYYDKGWPENNVFRMDHYPYKPKMNIVLYKKSAFEIQKIYSTFREEINRLKLNNGKVIIPMVIFKTSKQNFNITDVEVTAHNLRNDIFKDGVITAIDVILSLGDKGLISYEITWYENILNAEINTYFVEGINGSYSEDRCGFVYEAGDFDFKDTLGNHIHIPADIRIIKSPEYEKWFYGCI